MSYFCHKVKMQYSHHQSLTLIEKCDSVTITVADKEEPFGTTVQRNPALHKYLQIARILHVRLQHSISKCQISKHPHAYIMNLHFKKYQHYSKLKKLLLPLSPSTPSLYLYAAKTTKTNPHVSTHHITCHQSLVCT